MIISQPILPHFPVKEFVEIIKLVEVTLRKKKRKKQIELNDHVIESTVYYNRLAYCLFGFALVLFLFGPTENL